VTLQGNVSQICFNEYVLDSKLLVEPGFVYAACWVLVGSQGHFWIKPQKLCCTVHLQTGSWCCVPWLIQYGVHGQWLCMVGTAARIVLRTNSAFQSTFSLGSVWVIGVSDCWLAYVDYSVGSVSFQIWTFSSCSTPPVAPMFFQGAAVLFDIWKYGSLYWLLSLWTWDWLSQFMILTFQYPFGVKAHLGY